MTEKEIKINVIPSENRPPDKRVLSMKYRKTLPQIPSNIMLLGRAGAGKSSCLYTLLHDGYVTPKGKSVFDEMIIYLGTQDSVSAFEEIKCKNKVILHDFNQDDFEEYIEDLKKHQMEKINKGKSPRNICIVFDDFVGENILKPYKGKAPLIQRIALTSRHELNTSLIICSQIYKSNGLCNVALRNNINYYICYALARNDLDKIIEEHQGFYEKDELMDHMLRIFQKPHNFMMINYKKPEQERYTEGFVKLLPPPKCMANSVVFNKNKKQLIVDKDAKEIKDNKQVKG